MPLRVSLILVALCCMRGGTSFAIHALSFRPTAVPSPPRMASTDVEDASSPSSLMEDILQGNSTATTHAVKILMEVRGTDKLDEYLGEMLPPDRANLPWWTRLPLTRRFSRRARQLRLSELLELSTPGTSSEEESAENDTEEIKKRRARRSLFILLQSMASNPESDVFSMLAFAKKDLKVGTLSAEEMLQRTPDLETPKYEVLASKKGFEVRRYEKFSVCSVTMNEIGSSGSDKESASKLSNPQLSGATSFGALAGYLFGKNENGVAMKMTTPVLSEGEGASRKMSFVLPSDYWEEEGQAPRPLSDSSVKVSSVEASLRAVVAFPGLGRKVDVANRSEKLREMLKSDKEWKAVEGAPVILAQYNDPFTPPWKRRNEVSILVHPSNK